MVVSSRSMARLIGVGASCATALGAGLVLVFKLVTPESIRILGTFELLGLLGLLVLPVGVLAALRSAAPLRTSPSAPPAPSSPAEQPRQIVVLAADLRDRTAQRHRRRVSAPAGAASRTRDR